MKIRMYCRLPLGLLFIVLWDFLTRVRSKADFEMDNGELSTRTNFQRVKLARHTIHVNLFVLRLLVFDILVADLNLVLRSVLVQPFKKSTRFAHVLTG